MFDIGAIQARFGNRNPQDIEFVISNLSPNEAGVAFNDPSFKTLEDFVVLARMKVLPSYDFDFLAAQLVKEEYIPDFYEFSSNWTNGTKFYEGRSIFEVSGRTVDKTYLEESLTHRIAVEGKRARVFYFLRHPDRMNPLTESGQESGTTAGFMPWVLAAS